VDISPLRYTHAQTSNNNHNSLSVMIGTIGVAYFLGVAYLRETARRLEEETKRALVASYLQVSSYLQAFDTHDINVQHSNTGGWHGTYVGKLVEGESTSHKLTQTKKDENES
jgi:hypothetical protein